MSVHVSWGSWLFLGVALAVIAFGLVRQRRAVAPREFSLVGGLVRVTAGFVLAVMTVCTGMRSPDREDMVRTMPSTVELVTHGVPDAPIDRIQYLWIETDRSGMTVATLSETKVLEAGKQVDIDTARGTTFTLRVSSAPTSLADVHAGFEASVFRSSLRVDGNGGSGLVLPAGDEGLPFDVMSPRAPIAEPMFDPIDRGRFAVILARPLRRGETLEPRPSHEFLKSIAAGLGASGGGARMIAVDEAVSSDPLARLVRQTTLPGSLLLVLGVLLACFNRRIPLTTTFAGLLIAVASMGVLIRAEHRRHVNGVVDTPIYRAIAALSALGRDAAHPSAAGHAAEAVLDWDRPDAMKSAALWCGATGDPAVAASPEMKQALDRGLKHASPIVRAAAQAIRERSGSPP